MKVFKSILDWCKFKLFKHIEEHGYHVELRRNTLRDVMEWHHKYSPTILDHWSPYQLRSNSPTDGTLPVPVIEWIDERQAHFKLLVRSAHTTPDPTMPISRRTLVFFREEDALMFKLTFL